MAIRIVVAGGNYAGLNAVRHLYSTLVASTKAPKVQITLVDRRDGFLHYIGITRGITEPHYGQKLWVPYADVLWLQHPQITIKQATVQAIHPQHVELSSGEHLRFNYLITALGQSRFAPIGVNSPTKQDFEQQLHTAFAQIKQARSIAVVGAGAVGIEMAADIKSDFPDKSVTLVHSRKLPLPGPFGDELRHKVVDILKNQLQIQLMLGQRVVAQDPPSDDMGYKPDVQPSTPPEQVWSMASAADSISLTLSSADQQHKVQSNCVLRCLGTFDQHHLLKLPKQVISKAGIRVLDTMQIDDPAYSHIYACGDICARSSVKLAGVAMYDAYVAATNIARSIVGAKDSELMRSPEFPSKILLLMGKNHFAMEVDRRMWSDDETRPFVFEDMGLQRCIEALSLHQEPSAYSPFDPPPAF
ncbi:hypothetical protein IWW36_004908 [Coemansia brasiliensis]|uniref:FAD/NAD(P)-binding domain-containing protein n=1 Tax=Coemansia brasiliensis TaxID=2650707 RepID=A0A9W8LXL4_9FUNG|nr:hypothetical protein IWW36_004908 [Coemansia brasiliensis]